MYWTKVASSCAKPAWAAWIQRAARSGFASAAAFRALLAATADADPMFTAARAGDGDA